MASELRVHQTGALRLPPSACFATVTTHGRRQPCAGTVVWHGLVQTVHGQRWRAGACDVHRAGLIDRCPSGATDLRLLS
ncbi:MAG TPA: hypothetical protein VGL60_03055 [Acidimicrobiales bacterium]